MQLHHGPQRLLEERCVAHVHALHSVPRTWQAMPLREQRRLDRLEALLEHGAKKAANGVGLKGKEAAVMKALGLK